MSTYPVIWIREKAWDQMHEFITSFLLTYPVNLHAVSALEAGVQRILNREVLCGELPEGLKAHARGPARCNIELAFFTGEGDRVVLLSDKLKE